jgi:hypothetical protein
MTDTRIDSPGHPRTRQAWVFASLLAGLLIVRFWPVLVEGRVFAPTDMVFDFAFFKADAPAGVPSASNPLLSDAVLKFYPWQVAARTSLERGGMPWWNPYIYAGTPLFANGESAILYPINLMGLALPHHAALAFSAILRLFVAGVGMFLFVRAIGVGALGSALAGFAFALGGPMTVWLNYPVGNGYAWLPVLFYITQRLLSTRRLAYSAAAGVVIAIQVLGGHYQTVFIMLVAWAAYGLRGVVWTRRLGRDWRPALGAALLLANAATIGLALAAIQLVPFRAWLAGTGEASRRAAERLSSWSNPGLVQDAVGTAITMAIPNFLGNPTLGTMTSFWGTNFIEQTTYAGIVALALAIYAVALRGRRSAERRDAGAPADPLVFFSVLGSVFLLLAVDAPVVGLLNRLPVFDLIAFQRYRIVFVFCVAIAAGFGVDELLRGSRYPDRVRRLAQGLALYAAAGMAALIAVRLVLVHFEAHVTSYNRVRQLYPLMLKAFSLSYVPMYFPILAAAAAAVAVFCFRKGLLPANSAAVLLIGLASADLMVFGAGFNPTSPAAAVFPDTEAARYLRQGLGSALPERIVATADDLPPNTATPYLLYDVAGSDFVGRRYAEFALRAGGAMVGANRIRFTRFEPRLLEVLGVRYVVSSRQPEGLDAGRLEKVFSNDHVAIFQNSARLPRAFLAREATVAASDKEILDLLVSPGFDSATRIVLEEKPPDWWHAGQPSPADRVGVAEYRPGRVVMDAKTAEPAFLFISDAHDPGWTARIDGVLTKIFRADFAFMAVPVPPGGHRVELTYEPPGLRLGGAVTAGGAGLTCATLLLGWATVARQRRRSASMRSSERRRERL